MREESKFKAGCALAWPLFVMIALVVIPAGAGAASVDAKMLSYYESVLAPKKGSGSGFEGFMNRTRKRLASDVTGREQILIDLNAWIDQNPYNNLTPRALMLRADINGHGISKHLALLDWLTVKVLFASSSYATKAKNLARETISEDKYKHDRELLESILNSSPRGKGSYRHAALLHLFSGLTGSHFRDPLAHAYRNFLATSRSHEMAPMVQLALAKNRAMEDVRESVFHYETLIAVYPGSSYVADAYLAIADFNQERLHQPDEAVEGYNKVIRSYARSPVAPKACLNLAITYERHFRDDERAIGALNNLVRKYPRTDEATQGGEMLGRLYEKTKQYDSAVTAYSNMPNISRDRDAIIDSLAKASLVAETKLRDYKRMIEINHRICRSYPNNDVCAEAHYKSGSAYEKRLSDPKHAVVEYHAVVKNFPDHRLAKKAASRIKSINGGGINLNLNLF